MTVSRLRSIKNGPRPSFGSYGAKWLAFSALCHPFLIGLLSKELKQSAGH